MPTPHIQVVKDPAALAQEAARRVAQASKQAIADHGSFSIALSGGSTPKALYAVLAEEPYKSSVDWAKWDVYWGDERCVPPDNKDSNYKTAYDALLTKVPIAAAKVYRMKGEIDPNTAATEYGQLLKQKFGDGSLDLVLLGMGPDGHTLSLFPGTAGVKETQHRCIANFVPKLNTWRVTMSAPFVNKAAGVMVMLAGADKTARVKEVLEGPREPDRLPIQLIDPKPGAFTWLMDAAAAGMESAG
jgi:6-phosphogluconolactonase